MKIFQNLKQIEDYIKEKEVILKEYGFSKYGFYSSDFGMVVSWKKDNDCYLSVLLLSPFMGKGIVKEIQERYNLKIITTKKCGIEEYLIKHNIPYVLADGDLYEKSKASI